MNYQYLIPGTFLVKEGEKKDRLDMVAFLLQIFLNVPFNGFIQFDEILIISKNNLLEIFPSSRHFASLKTCYSSLLTQCEENTLCDSSNKGVENNSLVIF